MQGFPYVAPSGEMIYVVAKDGSGNPANVTSIAPPNDVQTLTLGTGQTGAPFTVTDGTHTVTITPQAASPTSSGLYNFAGLTPGVTYRGYSSRDAGQAGINVRIYQGSSPTGTPALATLNANTFGAASDLSYGGSNWQAFPPDSASPNSFVATGTAACVLETAPNGVSYFWDGAFMLVGSDGSHLIVKVTDPGAYFSSPGPTGANANVYGGHVQLWTGSGDIGGYNLSASAVQSALAPIYPGGVTVTANAGGTVLTITSTAAVAVPTLATSDSNVTIVHNFVGGSFPTLRINGGSPIALNEAIAYPDAPRPYVALPLPVDSPSPQYQTMANSGNQVVPGMATYSGSGWNAGDGGSGPATFYSATPGDTASIGFDGLNPATYQLAITWDQTLNPPGGYSGFSYCNNTSVQVKDGSGNVLGTYTVDQTAPPSGASYNGVGYHVLGSFTLAPGTIRLNVVLTVPTGNSGKVISADAALLTRTSASVAVKVQPSDVATVTTPAGFIGTGSGPLPGLSDAPATNQSGQPNVVPFTASAKTMKVGYNFESDTLLELVYRYSNLAKRAQGPFGLTSDANGYPLTSSGSTISNVTLMQPGATYGGMNGKHTVVYPVGTYSTVQLFGIATAITPVSSNVVSGHHVDVYNVQAYPNIPSPYFGINIVSSDPSPSAGVYRHDLQDLRVYPPDPSDPSGNTAWGTDPSSPPPKFHPHLTGTLLSGAKSLRFMDSIGTNDSNIVNYSDLVPQSKFGYFGAVRTISAAVADYRQYTGADVYFDQSSYPVIQITTSAPHGLVDGMNVAYSGSGNVTWSNGHTDPANFAQGACRVVSPTVVLLKYQNEPGGLTMSTAPFSGGTVGCQVGGAMPWLDMIELVNTIPSVTEMYVNIPFCMTDAAVTQMGTDCKNLLKSGVTVHVEYTNEAWNFRFINWHSCCGLTRTLGLGEFQQYYQGYAYRANQVHNLFVAAMGTRGSSVRRVIGTQTGNPAQSLDPILAYASPHSIPIHEVCCTGYFNGENTYEPSQSAKTDLLSVGQMIDLMQLSHQYAGAIASDQGGVRAALDAAGYTSTTIVGYECGPDQLYPIPSSVNVNLRNHAVARHPRMYATHLMQLQRAQDNGMTLWNQFYLAGSVIDHAWSTWWYPGQQPGTGSVSADALNVSNPQSPTGVKSEVGGAISYWNSLVGGSTPPPTPSGSIFVPGNFALSDLTLAIFIGGR